VAFLAGIGIVFVLVFLVDIDFMTILGREKSNSVTFTPSNIACPQLDSVPCTAVPCLGVPCLAVPCSQPASSNSISDTLPDCDPSSCKCDSQLVSSPLQPNTPGSTTPPTPPDCPKSPVAASNTDSQSTTCATDRYWLFADSNQGGPAGHNNQLIAALKFIAECDHEGVSCVIGTAAAVTALKRFDLTQMRAKYPCWFFSSEKSGLQIEQQFDTSRAFKLKRRWGSVIQLLKPTADLQAALDTFRQENFAGSSYVAVHLRKFEDGCMRRVEKMLREPLWQNSYSTEQRTEKDKNFKDLCPVQPAYAKTIVDSPVFGHYNKVFVASDGRWGGAKAEYERVFGADKIVFGGKNFMLDFFLLAEASVLIANPLSTMSVNACLYNQGVFNAFCHMGQWPGEDFMKWYKL
jgi:hypothetical protein